MTKSTSFSASIGAGQRTALFVGPAPEDKLPKDATPGRLLTGILVLAKLSGAAGSGDAPGAPTFTYLVRPTRPRAVALRRAANTGPRMSCLAHHVCWLDELIFASFYQHLLTLNDVSFCCGGHLQAGPHADDAPFMLTLFHATASSGAAEEGGGEEACSEGGAGGR